MIRSIIEGVNTISSMMESLTAQMMEQQNINRDVNVEATKVKQRSDEIKNSTEEQKTAVTEIVRSVASVNELTQSYAAGARGCRRARRTWKSSPICSRSRCSPPKSDARPLPGERGDKRRP